MASNYEVNIKLDTKQAKDQLRELEERIAKLNRLALKGKASKQILKTDRDALALKIKENRLQDQKIKKDRLELRIARDTLKVEQQTANVISRQTRGGGGAGLATGGGAAKGGGGSGALSSAIISGAFPLLFGQGPLVGAAGALGGGIGSMVGGPMGGFAGGLLATSIATPIQQLGIEAAKLGNALNPATKDVEALTKALGVTGTEFEKNIKLLKELGDEEAAFEEARKRMLGLVGSGGVASLEEFGKDSTELANSFAQLMTQMQAGFADMINSAGIFKILAEGVKRTVTLTQANQNVFNDPQLAEINKQRERRAQLGAIRANKEGIPGFRELDQMAVDRQDQLNVEKAIADAKELQRKVAEATMKKTEEEIEFLEKHRDLTAEEFAIEVKIRELEDKGVEVDRERFIENEKRLNQLQRERKLAEETAAAFERMAQSIATDISKGIQGMIRGTSTLNDMLNNVLNKLIDAAFNMAFFGNAAGSLMPGGGLFGKLFGGLFRADGGPVKGGNSYVVGERGPEMFTPGVSGTITPNHALGGSTNVVVNVDASGSAVEGDEEQGRELGRLISVAVQSEIIQQKRPGGLLA